MKTSPSPYPPSQLRVIIIDQSGAEQCRCTLAEFVGANESAWPRRLRGGKMVANIAERIEALGADTLDCGATGVFTIRAE